MTSHMVLPDTQVKPGVPINHLEAAANYIIDKQPEVIVHLGDHWDMPSLSGYDKNTRKIEGARYHLDIEAGIKAMEVFNKPFADYNRTRRKKYAPRKVFIPGNHEQRILRHVNANPALYGTLSFDNFELKRFGWEVYDFLEVVNIDGIAYSHYFYNPNTGKPWTGTAQTMLNNIGFTFTMGHQQGRKEAEKSLANGKTIRALIAGSFYQHDEDYKGPQANSHWRGCIYKTEVKDGNYCICELSLDYLLKRWL